MKIGVRWTIGDVSSRGFEALALSITGARTVFGDDAQLVVCVNTVSTRYARERVGAAAEKAEWRLHPRAVGLARALSEWGYGSARVLEAAPFACSTSVPA